MVRQIASALAIVLLSSFLPSLLDAQALTDLRGPVLRVETNTESGGGGGRVTSGWVYNDGQAVVGLLRLRLEVLDDSGKVLGEQLGWAYGNVAPGGRAYFRIQEPPVRGKRRVTVESYVIQSLAPRQESP